MALIVFDIDGTLLQTDRVTIAAVCESFAAFGLPEPDAKAVRATFGQPVEEYEAWLAAQCPKRAAELVAATNARELELIGEAGRLYPGVRAALETLRGTGHRLAVFSNGHEAYVREVLEAHALGGFFALVCARGAPYADKSAMLACILERFPERPLIVVGDREDDISSAHAHDGLAIGAAYGFGQAGELRDANAVARDPSAIPSLVTELTVEP